MVLTALLCALVVPINPQGLDLLLFPFRTLSSVQQGAIAEWASPDFHLPELWPFLALMLVAWAALALARRRPSGPDLLRALGFSAMALRSSRYVGLAAVILAPILVRCGAGLLARLERHFSPRSESATRTLAARARGWPAVNWGLLVVVLLGAGLKIAQPLNPRIIDRVHRERFPIAATDHLLTRSDELPPELFNEYGWGGYLIWRDAARVFIDGRADPYGDDLIRAYRHVTSVRPGWEETLARYGVRTALLRANSALGVVMRESAEWRETYADDVAVIFVRETEH